MRKIVSLLTFLTVLAAPATAFATPESAFDIMRSTVIQANGGVPLEVTSDAFVTARFNPLLGHYNIELHMRGCPPIPEVGWDEDTEGEVIRITPARTVWHTCYHWSEQLPHVPQYVALSTEGARKNPIGVAAKRKWIRRILANKQKRIIKLAGCRKAKRGVYITVHQHCPSPSLASDFTIGSDGAQLQWPTCKYARPLRPQLITVFDPLSGDGRTSRTTTCNGATIPLALPSITRFPAAPPLAEPAPVPPAPAT